MRLIIEDDEGRKTIVPFGPDAVTIGRQDGNTVLLKEKNISRKHASLVRQNGSVLIEDLNSFNGVRINGDRIQGRTQVQEGDLIQIGDYDLAIEREATEAPDRRTEPAMAPVRAPGYGLDLPPEASSETMPPSSSPTRPQTQTAVIKSPYGPDGELNFDGVPVPAAERPKLVITNTGERGRELAIDKTVMSIGRASGPADLTIDHRSISKLHAKIALDTDGTWHITDLKSANGMRINGEEYGDAPLSAGDVLELGHVQFKFVGAGQRFSIRGAGASGGSTRRRRVVGASVVGASLVIVASLLTLRHPNGDQKSDTPDVTTPSRPHQALAPIPAIPAPPTPTPPPPGAEAADDAAAADADRASQALQQAKSLARARKWDKADEKLKEAEEVDADDPTVARLRRDIDANLEKEAAKEAARDAAKDQVKVAKADRKPKPHAAAPEAAPETEPPPPVTAAPAPPKGDRRGKAMAVYEEAIATINGGDYVGALAKLERAAELDPSMAEAQKGLGICYAKLHKPDKGAYHYEQYLKLKPGAADANDVRKMLQDYYKTKGE